MTAIMGRLVDADANVWRRAAVVVPAIVLVAASWFGGSVSVLEGLTLVVLALGVVCLVQRRRTGRTLDIDAGALVVMGLTLIATGAILTLSEQQGHAAPAGPGIHPSHVLSMAGAALVACALAALLRARMPDRWVGVLFEGALAVAILAFLPWAFAARANDAASTALRFTPVVVDAFVVWLVVRLTASLRRRGVMLILASFVCLVVADAAIAAQVVAGDAVSQELLALLRLWSCVILAVAVLDPVLREPVEQVSILSPRYGPGKVAASLGLTLLAPAVFALQAFSGQPPRLAVVLSGSSVLAFLVAAHLARQAHEGVTSEYRAHHDALTGLPERTMFLDRLDVALAQARRTGSRVGVMFLDLDRFKTINDSLGHAVGNQLLQAVAERLRACVREADTVARVGGDEFMVLVPDVESEAACDVVGEKLLAAFAQPFGIGGRELVTSTSIGIAIFPDNGTDADTLTKNADIAMYRAKSSGRNTYQHYTPDLSTRARAKHTLESRLRAALDDGELELHYQPRVDPMSGSVVGFEALARWPHPELGFVPPTAFIPLAEETGLIVPLGDWVLDEACRQTRRWSESAGLRVPVAVNLSAREFMAKHVEHRIARALHTHGLSPEMLELEITESIFMHDLSAASDVMVGLRDMGVRCSIDDFGTGYSGLTYLSQLPIYSLKIDQSFVERIGSTYSGERIVEAIITLARSLSMKVVAEGVETHAQAEFLRSHRCDEVQGILFSPPLDAEAVGQLLDGTRAWSAAGVVAMGAPSEDIAALLRAVGTNGQMDPGDESRINEVLTRL
jgi:diguanylate cyclase (GGDEF)-like protein